MEVFQSEHRPPSIASLKKPDQQWRPQVPLAELPPGQYIDTAARVATLKVRRVEDQLGDKPVYSGILEDRTFRVPFVCHKTSLPFEKNLVLSIKSAYVHEFLDKSLLLVLTEYSGAETRYSEDIREYSWTPRIGGIRRPVWYLTLRGTVSNVYSSSGLVKRCNKCKSVVREKCVNGCGEDDWSWDVRTSARLYDGTGSMKMILGRYLTSRLLGLTLSEIFTMANAAQVQAPDNYDVFSFRAASPHGLSVVEALVEEPLEYRRHNKLVVTDGNSRICYPASEKIEGELISQMLRELNPDDQNDLWVIRNLVARALDIRIQEATGLPRVHGLHLLEDPINLYRCERARLYLGFSTKTSATAGSITVEASPQALVRESVWDYVGWRRSRGASAEAIRKMLLGHRANVVLAPNGHQGHVEELVFRKAGEEKVSEHDARTFPEFWKDTYGLTVSPEETPLLRVRLMGLDMVLTYPPSRVYFDRNVLFLTAGTEDFIEGKKAPIREWSRNLVSKAVQGLRIGETVLDFSPEDNNRIDLERILLHRIHDKLLGRTVEARGQIVQLRDNLCFFPEQVSVVD